jgi:hypothetical protein
VLTLGQTAPKKVPLDVNDVVREVIALVQRELISHRVSFAPSEKRSIAVEADRFRHGEVRS